MAYFKEMGPSINEFVQGPLGAFHFASAIVALICGAIVLSNPKGTAKHKRLGYIYFASMLALNLSAIPITNMTGSIGLFHLFVVMSLPTTLAALYFPLFGRTNPNWKTQHFTYMFWSYVGLIAASIAEGMVRLPILFVTDRTAADRALEASGGFWFAALVMVAVMAIAEVIFRRYRRHFFGGSMLANSNSGVS